MKRKFFTGAISNDATLGDRQIRVIASTPTEDREKDVMVPSGCILDNYANNPIVLFNHDSSQPVATAEAKIGSDHVEALVTFADKGISDKADEVCGLAKSGVLKTVSVGFRPVDFEPRKGGGLLYKQWELMEISIVSVPANPDALVIGRSVSTKEGKPEFKVGASRNLDVDADASWDGEAAKSAVFEKAGFDGDNPDSGFARKAFLVYDAANPELKGSYHLPFATVKDGRLVAVAAGIRNAASRLPQTDIPSDVADKARAVIDHYEGKMKDKAIAAVTKHMQGNVEIKSLFDVAQLAYVLDQLGWLEDCAEFEAAIEGDGSQVPAMLAAALKVVADALLAMTQEEVAELLAEEIDDGDATAKGFVDKSDNPIMKATGVIQFKAGRAISSANTEKLKSACDHMTKAMGHVNDVLGTDDDEDETDSNKSAAVTAAETKPAADTAAAGQVVVLNKRQRLLAVKQRQAV